MNEVDGVYMATISRTCFEDNICLNIKKIKQLDKSTCILKTSRNYLLFLQISLIFGLGLKHCM